MFCGISVLLSLPVSLLLVLPTSHLGNEVSLSGKTLFRTTTGKLRSHTRFRAPPLSGFSVPRPAGKPGWGDALPSCGVWAAGGCPGPRPSGGRWSAQGVEAQRPQTRPAPAGSPLRWAEPSLGRPRALPGAASSSFQSGRSPQKACLPRSISASASRKPSL